MLVAKGHVREAVSVTYANRAKPDHNEPVAKTGQLTRVAAQEELRWSADTIPIRSHATRDFTLAARRVAVGRIQAACTNHQRLAGAERLLRSRPERRTKLARVVASTPSWKAAQLAPASAHPGEMASWIDEVHSVQATGVGIKIKRKPTIISEMTSALSAKPPRSAKPRNNHKAVDDRAREAYRLSLAKFFGELSIVQRHLSAVIFQNSEAKIAGADAQLRTLVEKTEKFTTDEVKPRILTPTGAPSTVYHSMFVNVKNKAFIELAKSATLFEKYYHATHVGTPPWYPVVGLDCVVHVPTVPSFPANVAETARLGSAENLMFGLSDVASTWLPQFWQQRAAAMWEQWIRLRLTQEVQDARNEAALLKGAKGLTHIGLTIADSAWQSRFNDWWYQCVYEPLPMQWRKFAMPSLYRYYPKTSHTSSDHVVPMNIPPEKANEQGSDANWTTLVVTGIRVLHNTDAPNLLSEFVGILACVDESNMTCSEPAVFVTPSATDAGGPRFALHSIPTTPAEVAGQRRNPSVKTLSSEHWERRSLKRFGWAAGLDRPKPKPGSAPPQFEELRPKANSMTALSRTVIEPLPCERADAYIVLDPKSLNALSMILYMMRSSVMLQILKLWNDCLEGGVAVSVENLFSLIEKEWTVLHHASYLRSQAADPRDSDEDSFVGDAANNTHDCFAGRVLGKLPENLCWLNDEHRPRPLTEGFGVWGATSTGDILPDSSTCSEMTTTCSGYDDLFLQVANPLGPAIKTFWELAMKLRNISRLPYAEGVGNCRLAAELAFQLWEDLVLVAGLKGLTLLEVGERQLFGLAVGCLAGDAHYMGRFQRKWQETIDKLVF